MPTLALPAHPPARPLAAFVFQADEWMERTSDGNGLEALRLSELVNEVFTHWSQRAEVLVASTESDDDITYEHLLPRPHFVVRARFRMIGRLQPRQFTVDD